jgi:hypothetical protein
MLYPHKFKPNELAQRVITKLSDGRVTQRWAGDVVLCEYDRDLVTGEVGFPQPMTEDRIAQINALCDRT